MKSRELSVLAIGTLALGGCKFPGSDICSGLAVGDLVDIRIDGQAPPNGATPTACDSQLGFEPGTAVVAEVSTMGDSGCGLATGPITVQSSQFVFDFDAERSIEVGDARSHHWVNASLATKAQCAGDLVVRLENVVPELIGTSNSGELSVRYVPKAERADCPTGCNIGFSVQVSKQVKSD